MREVEAIADNIHGDDGRGTSEARKKWLKVADVARELEVDPQQARRLIKSGKIPGYKIGGEYKVKTTELQRWIEAQRVEV